MKERKESKAGTKLIQDSVKTKSRGKTGCGGKKGKTGLIRVSVGPWLTRERISRRGERGVMPLPSGTRTRSHHRVPSVAGSKRKGSQRKEKEWAVSTGGGVRELLGNNDRNAHVPPGNTREVTMKVGKRTAGGPEGGRKRRKKVEGNLPPKKGVRSQPQKCRGGRSETLFKRVVCPTTTKGRERTKGGRLHERGVAKKGTQG